MLIFTQAASLVNTFFKMAQGQVVKERSKKRIFHFSATNAELCSADLHEKTLEHARVSLEMWATCSSVKMNTGKKKINGRKKKRKSITKKKKKRWLWAGEAAAGATVHRKSR